MVTTEKRGPSSFPEGVYNPAEEENKIVTQMTQVPKYPQHLIIYRAVTVKDLKVMANTDYDNICLKTMDMDVQAPQPP